MHADPSLTAEIQPRIAPVLAEHAAHLLARAHFAARDLANRTLEPFGLEIRHFVALLVIDDEGPMSQQELSRFVRCDRTTMVSLMDELESAGYVERRRNPDDRRAYALEITAAGREVLAEAREAIVAIEREFFAPLSEAEEQELKRLLTLLILRP
jgi:DNA-binding MarR family transcriptional regulator